MHKIVVVGTSLGGVAALEAMLSGLPASLQVPVVIVQHRDSRSSRLVTILQRYTSLRVREAHDKEELKPGIAYVAPPDYHTLVEPEGIALSVDAPVSYARPSIDVLFESAADSYGKGAIGVVLTGANSDGARGAAAIKRAGGCVIVQDPDHAECAAMPRAAIASTTADAVLQVHDIAPEILRILAGNAVNAPASASLP